jgi:hypothetical protein
MEPQKIPNGQLALEHRHDLSVFSDPNGGCRNSLNCVYYDADEKAIVATDSKVLAFVPVTQENAPPDSMRIPVPMLKHLKPRDLTLKDKKAKRLPPTVRKKGSRIAGTKNGTRLLMKEVEARFPKWKAVVPTLEGRPMATLSAHLVGKVASYATGLFGSGALLDWHFSPNYEAHVIHVKEDRYNPTVVATIVLMPLAPEGK